MLQKPIENTNLGYRLTNSSEPRTKLIITDVDGTLASFWDYFVPAVREFLQVLSAQLDTPVEGLAEDIGRIIDRRGTHEYPWLLEETSFAWKHFANRREEFIQSYVVPFWKTLDEYRAKYLRPYPQVIETLQALKAQGIKIVALSDAPDYMARVRNKQVFDGLLDAVYALETVEPGEDEIWQPISLEHGRKRLQEITRSTSNLKTKLHVLPKSYEKPCPKGLDQVLEDFQVYPHEAIFIGDSLTKDGLVANLRGIRYIWAHYGITLPAEYDEFVHSQLKPAGSAKDEPTKSSPAPFVEAIAARYDEILNHI